VVYVGDILKIFMCMLGLVMFTLPIHVLPFNMSGIYNVVLLVLIIMLFFVFDFFIPVSIRLEGSCFRVLCCGAFQLQNVSGRFRIVVFRGEQYLYVFDGDDIRNCFERMGARLEECSPPITSINLSFNRFRAYRGGELVYECRVVESLRQVDDRRIVKLSKSLNDIKLRTCGVTVIDVDKVGWLKRYLLRRVNQELDYELSSVRIIHAGGEGVLASVVNGDNVKSVKSRPNHVLRFRILIPSCQLSSIIYPYPDHEFIYEYKQRFNDGLFLGYTLQRNLEKTYPLHIPFINYHWIIVGATGSGKTTLVMHVVSQLKHNVLIIDPTGQMSIIADRVLSVRDLRLNIFSNMLKDNAIDVFTSLLRVRYGREDVVTPAQEAILSAFTSSRSGGKCFSKLDVMLEACMRISRREEERNLYAALRSRIKPFVGGALDVVGEPTAPELKGRIAVDLSSLGGDEEKTLAIHLILNLVFILAEQGRISNLYIVLDEAHRVAQIGLRHSILDRIYRELRKYGVYIIAVTQNPSLITPDVFTNSGVRIVMRLSGSEARDMMNVLGVERRYEDEFIKIVTEMNTGEFIIQTPEIPPTLASIRNEVDREIVRGTLRNPVVKLQEHVRLNISFTYSELKEICITGEVNSQNYTSALKSILGMDEDEAYRWIENIDKINFKLKQPTILPLLNVREKLYKYIVEGIEEFGEYVENGKLTSKGVEALSTIINTAASIAIESEWYKIPLRKYVEDNVKPLSYPPVNIRRKLLEAIMGGEDDEEYVKHYGETRKLTRKAQAYILKIAETIEKLVSINMT